MTAMADGNRPAPSAGSAGYTYDGPVAAGDRELSDRELANKAFVQDVFGSHGAGACKPLLVDTDAVDGFIRQWEEIKSATVNDRVHIDGVKQAQQLAADAEASGMYDNVLKQSAEELQRHHQATLDYIDKHIENLRASNKAYREVEQANTDHVNRAGGKL
jgi:hypothetical protein